MRRYRLIDRSRQGHELQRRVRSRGSIGQDHDGFTSIHLILTDRSSPGTDPTNDRFHNDPFPQLPRLPVELGKFWKLSTSTSIFLPSLSLSRKWTNSLENESFLLFLFEEKIINRREQHRASHEYWKYLPVAFEKLIEKLMILLRLMLFNIHYFV